MVLILILYFFGILAILAGGDGTCSPYIPTAIKISNTFTSAIVSMQNDCIRSISLHALTQYNQPYKTFTNALYEIYSQCAKNESDLFVEMYDRIHSVIDPENSRNGDTVGDYLSGTVDVTRYPFSCVAANVDSALDLVAIYDKELTDASNLHLKYHRTPKADPIES